MSARTGRGRGMFFILCPPISSCSFPCFSLLPFLLLFPFLRQGLTMQPRLGSDTYPSLTSQVPRLQAWITHRGAELPENILCKFSPPFPLFPFPSPHLPAHLILTSFSLLLKLSKLLPTSGLCASVVVAPFAWNNLLQMY